MKSKYISWKHGLSRLTGLACFVCLASLTGCKELTCDFSYSPTSPAAGEVVTFTNASTGADDYYWTFGDKGSSTSSSPTHIFRKPGTYTVTLKIVRNKVEKRTRTQYVTVTDTIPAIACDSDTVYSFTPVKFYAQVYNPWNKSITYQWSMPDDAIVLAGKSLDSSAVVCYFNQYGKATQVGLTIQLGDKSPFVLTYDFTPEHNEGISVIYANQAQAYEQYTYVIYKQRKFQVPAITTDKVNLDYLRYEQDTTYLYGQKTYTVAIVSELLAESIQGFQVDRLMNKIYAYSNKGLWVCSLTGINKRQLVSTSVQAIKVDGDSNCLYWSTNEGLFVHRLLKTYDNMESFSPQVVTNQYTSIHKISVNPNLH